MNPLIVGLTLEEETKGTFRYQEAEEAGKPPAIRTLYVAKWAMGEGEPPKSLKVTIEAV